ncbi:MAG: InlB B-repeat-containing protein, partial [Bacilli bacterium]
MKLIKSVSIFTLLFFVIIFLTGCNNKKVSIIFDTDGGSSVNDLIEIDLDNDFTLPVTEKDNFDFLGWYLDDELMNIELIRKYFIDNKEILSLNLKAKWDIHSFKVKFYDGDLLLKEETVLYNESATAPELEEKIGYTFKRWDTIFTNVKSDIEVLAEWETNSHFVRYYDYDNTLLKEVPVEFNQELSSEIAPIANREGYDFIGWNKILPENMPDEDIVLIAEYDINQYSIFFVENGGSIVDTITDDYKTSVVKPVDPIKKGNKFIGWYLDSDFTQSYVFSTIPSKDITLYAKWEINKYNLIYLNDDLNLIEQLSIEYNQDLSLINSPLPIKKGHEFIGWDQDLPSNMPDEDIILIAEFSINQYTIFFVENGGSTVDSIVQNYDTVVVKPTNPIKPGFIFVDWYLDADFINVYSFSKMTDEDIILYAKWEADESLIFEFEDYMLDKFSNYIEYDIVLPINYKGIDIVWTSSNSQVVSSSGQYFRPYIKTNLSLTANLEDENS